jgi:putative ABC transport system permease protein
MNLAIRDIRAHKMRFLLTCLGLGMLLTVVMAMSGIYRGLVADATRIVNVVPAQLWIVQHDTRGPFAEASRLPENLQYSIAAVPGVRRASPVSFQNVQIRHGDKLPRMMLVG